MLNNIKKWGKTTRGIISMLVFTLLIGTNILTLTWSAASVTAQTVLAAVGITSVLVSSAASSAATLAATKTEYKRKALKTKNNTKRLVKTHLGPVRSRINKRALATVGSTVLEAIPFIGIGAAVGGLTYEIYSSCQDAKSINDLQLQLNIETQGVPKHCKTLFSSLR